MTKRITSFFALTTFVLAASGSAFAADIAVKAPLPAPVPVYNWTGWYVGVNAGASFGRAKTDFNVDSFTAAGTVSHVNLPGFAGSDTEHPSGFMGGGQIGYNWQYSPLIVVGLEADFQGALERDTNNLSNPFSGTFPLISNTTGLPVGSVTGTGTVVTNYSTQIDWFGTVRGRIGYVWGTNGDVLTYVTGGLAYGEVKINGTNISSVSLNGTPATSITQVIGHSQVNTGWVVGYGTEGRIDFWGSRNWTWKIEGLYMDLGTLDATGVTSGVSIGGFGVTTATGGQVNAHSRFTDGILRAGLNYQFH
jgi:outer membrane immunogenic protein